MVPMLSLWMPILLSAIAVFLLSSMMHMMLKYHQSDYGMLPNEEAFRAAVGPLNVPPGDYFVPRGEGMAAMKDPAFIEKMKAGPILHMTVLPNGVPTMGAQLMQWFLYSVVVGVFAAYIASRALLPGAAYLDVFRFAGTTAFACYAVALTQNSIWYRRKWSTTIKSYFDGLVYALVTAGVFGWLWPN